MSLGWAASLTGVGASSHFCPGSRPRTTAPTGWRGGGGVPAGAGPGCGSAGSTKLGSQTRASGATLGRQWARNPGFRLPCPMFCSGVGRAPSGQWADMGASRPGLQSCGPWGQDRTSGGLHHLGGELGGTAPAGAGGTTWGQCWARQGLAHPAACMRAAWACYSGQAGSGQAAGTLGRAGSIRGGRAGDRQTDRNQDSGPGAQRRHCTDRPERGLGQEGSFLEELGSPWLGWQWGAGTEAGMPTWPPEEPILTPHIPEALTTATHTSQGAPPTGAGACRSPKALNGQPPLSFSSSCLVHLFFPQFCRLLVTGAQGLTRTDKPAPCWQLNPVPPLGAWDPDLSQERQEDADLSLNAEGPALPLPGPASPCRSCVPLLPSWRTRQELGKGSGDLETQSGPAFLTGLEASPPMPLPLSWPLQPPQHHVTSHWCLFFFLR